MLLKSQYFWRTYLGYVTVALIGTFLFSATLVSRVEQDQLVSLDSSMKVMADLLAIAVAPAIQRAEYEEIRTTVSNVAQDSSMRITVVDSNGIVLADSHENPMAMNNHLRRPEIQLAYTNGSGSSERYSFTLGENYRYFAVPIYARQQLAGFARVAKSSDDLRSEISLEIKILLRNSAVVAFAILLLAFYLASRQAGKVAELTAVAEEISKGNFERRIPEGNNLGLKKMAEAINQMARSSAQGVTEVIADRNRLTTIFTCMVEGVIDVDMDQKVLHINEAATRLLSVNEKECIGYPIWQGIRSQEILNALDEAIRNRSVIKTQMRLNRQSDPLIIDIYAASLSDDQGLPIGAVLVLHDITDIKKLERVRTDFVANASHELKTPITAIRGLTETILDDEEVDKETVIHFTNRVHAQSLRLSQLVGDLLTISRLENSQNEKDFDKINFIDLVRQSVKAAQTSAEEKGHTLVTELPDTELSLYADRQNMSQLIDNLIDNAIKYTEEPGTITVRLKKEGNWAVLEVQDTGLGVSPQYQQRVFERFYRVDKARSQSLGGTGLGLSIVKNIAEKHGGSVSVESQLGSGSTFTFRLPLNLS